MGTKFRYAALAATVAAGLGWAGGAQAAVETITLNIDHCSGGCLPGGGTGSVTVNDAGGVLSFDVDLTGNLVFQPSTGLDAFVFNLDKTPLSVTAGPTSGFTFVSASSGTIQEDGFGTFGYGLTYSGPRTAQALDFTVSAAGGLTLADLGLSGPPGTASVLFAADVFSSNLNGMTGNGNTGPIGGVSAAPEPSTWTMLLVGFAGLGYAAFRRGAKARLAGLTA
jgi:hypothetical protein